MEWTVGVQGDVLNIEAKTKADEPAQRLNQSPAFLELAFPRSKMATAALSKAVDKGLIQKVQTLQDGDNAVVRIFVLTKPKARLTKTEAGYRYSINMSEPASAAVSKPSNAGEPRTAATARQPKPPAAAPATTARRPKPPAAAPAATARQPKPAGTNPAVSALQPKPVAPPTRQPKPAAAPARQPKPPVAAQPREIPPPAATRNETPPVAAPAPKASPPPAEAAPVASSQPSGGPDRQAPITIVFENRPLGDAIAELADQGGYIARVDPKLNGLVNMSLSDTPFEDALSLLLQPYGRTVSFEISDTTVTVRKTASAEAAVKPAAPPATTANNPMVFEYYPFSTKDAQKMMDAARKAIPELSYRVDPVLNILLVQGPREDVVRLGELLKSMSNK